MKQERDDQVKLVNTTTRLFGVLSLAVDLAEQLGYQNTAIEIRRATLQLCFDSEVDVMIEKAFKDEIQGHA